MSRRPRQLYRETYHAGAMTFLPPAWPELKHQAEGGKTFRAVGCEMLAAGVVELPDGTQREYQDLRVYVEAK